MILRSRRNPFGRMALVTAPELGIQVESRVITDPCELLQKWSVSESQVGAS